LVAFRSPAHAIAKVLFQVAGEIDYENIVNHGDLLYNPTTYILLITFLVTMPVLFANLLVSHSSWCSLASFPGFHAQLLSLVVRKAGRRPGRIYHMMRAAADVTFSLLTSGFVLSPSLFFP